MGSAQLTLRSRRRFTAGRLSAESSRLTTVLGAGYTPDLFVCFGSQQEIRFLRLIETPVIRFSSRVTHHTSRPLSQMSSSRPSFLTVTPPSLRRPCFRNLTLLPIPHSLSPLFLISSPV